MIQPSPVIRRVSLVPRKCLALLLAIVATPWAGFALENTGSVQFEDCYAQWNAAGLTVGNHGFEHSWTLSKGELTPVQFRTKNPDSEWLARPPAAHGAPEGSLTVVAEHGSFAPGEAAALKLTVSVNGKRPRQIELKLFPGIAGIVFAAQNQNTVKRSTASDQANGIEPDDQPAATDLAGGPENLVLAARHWKLTEVTLTDQTDAHNELVFQKEWLLAPNEAPFGLAGNAVVLEDTLTRQGLVLLKLAPNHQARTEIENPNFFVNPHANIVSPRLQDWPMALLAYQGGATGRTIALQQFQRSLRRPDFTRDGIFLSNTWGDRSRDARINEDFILKEIATGRQVGVEVIQIDDGWQKGRTKNSATRGGVWSGWWAADSNFWAPNSLRFPHGLKPVVEAAKAHGMKIGLWFSPDSSNQATNWLRDAECILRLYRELGIEYFKIDGLDTGHPLAAENERKLFDYVLQQSSNNVVFDLDVTAGNRPGYFGMPEIGPVFVENRYTDWHTYWPHQTLRNLWKLSGYVDPLRLRIEFLNNLRNQTNYANDPLAPACYRFDTLFAMTMAANPLGWFEVSNLASNQISDLAPLVEIWKRHRSRFHSGNIIPIGNSPDGIAWSGFASILPDHTGGYLLLFRELNEDSHYNLDLSPYFPTDVSASILAGRGTITQKEHRLTVSIPTQLDYLWIELKVGRLGSPPRIQTGTKGKL